MTHDSLRGLLEEQAGAGHLHSSGAFTIDMVRAQAKLRQHRLAGPHEYVLSLVRSAVLSGASQIRINTRYGRVEMSHDGVELTHDELEGLSSQLADESLQPRQRSLRELAMGLAGALGGQHGEALIISNGECLKLSQRGARLGTAQARGPSPGARIVLRRRALSSLWASLRHLVFAPLLYLTDVESLHRLSSQEAALVAARCRYCPAAVFLNDTPLGPCPWTGVTLVESVPRKDRAAWLARSPSLLTSAFSADDHLVQSFVVPHLDSADLLAAQAPFASTSDYRRVNSDWRTLPEGLPPNDKGRPLAILGLEVAMEPLASLLWVRDGVVLSKARVDLGCPGVVGVVSVSGLNLDLSQRAVVEDGNYHEMLQFLSQEAQLLRVKVVDNLNQLPHDLVQHLRRSLLTPA